MRATYLTGEHIYLRAMLKSDAQTALAWRHSPLPMSAVGAEKELEEAHKEMWGARQSLYAICRRDTDELVGSVKIATWSPLNAWVSFKLADWLTADEIGRLGREALRLTLQWQSGEGERPVVIAIIPAWEEAWIAEAEANGMERMVRFRQHLLHHGERHDLFIYQYIRPDWLPRLTNA